MVQSLFDDQHRPRRLIMKDLIEKNCSCSWKGAACDQKPVIPHSITQIKALLASLKRPIAHFDPAMQAAHVLLLHYGRFPYQ
jgi:hypothetical protein